jgi:hypothetical protein
MGTEKQQKKINVNNIRFNSFFGYSEDKPKTDESEREREIHGILISKLQLFKNIIFRAIH